MNKASLLLAAAASLLAAPAIADGHGHSSGEEKLAKALEGRTAGEPVSCIKLQSSSQSRIIDQTAIIYGSGNTIYVNRPANPQSLHSGDVLVTDLGGMQQLCSTDIVHIRAQGDLGAHLGTLSLGDFVPYTRNKN